PIIKDVSERNKENINSLILRELKLKGLVLGHQQIIRKLDATMGKTSEIIPVTLTSSGEISKTSSVATLEQWNGLEHFVKEKIQEIGSDIVAGEVSAYPYKRKTETGCDYCPYGHVCRFEKGVGGNDYRVLKDLSKTEVWDRILDKTQ
ncbi:MAG: PD-(D/E)XK nuclease family protein, partial [Vallitaleaceae bacterium]|nr:PD-(D/E)XK nuclease family protein [Vallitaleaceae bacterium]